MSIESWHESLGEGGYGSVNRIKYIHETLGRIDAAGKTASRCFKQTEVDIMTKVEHENIIKMYGCVEHQPHPIIILEYAPFGSLDKYIEKVEHFPLPADLYLKWAKESITGLEYLHGMRIIHRDVKPGNCLICNDRVLKLSDFGIAKQLEHSKSMTNASHLNGTPIFMAPEIHRDEIYSYKSDIYAYAMVLLVMWTGRSPFHGKGSYHVIFKVIKDNEFRPTIPSECPDILTRLLKKCWHGDRRKRPEPSGILKTLNKLKTSYDTCTHLQSITHDGNGQLEWARGVAVTNNGDVVIGDWKRDRVSVFDKTGLFQGHIRSSPSNPSPTDTPFDIATTAEGEIVVVYESCYADVFNEKREYIESLCNLPKEDDGKDDSWRTMSPTRTSVAVDDEGAILIGSFRKKEEDKSVTIHRRKVKGGHEKYGRRVSVPLRPDFLAANLIHGQSTRSKCMLISNWQSCQIAAVDYEGSQLFAVSPQIDGKQGQPYGITCDSENGSILIVIRHTGAKAESGNHHIHQHNSDDGKFITCIVQGLESPRGIALSKDEIVVANTGSVEKFYKKIVIREDAQEESNASGVKRADTGRLPRLTGTREGTGRPALNRLRRRNTFQVNNSDEAGFGKYTPRSPFSL